MVCRAWTHRVAFSGVLPRLRDATTVLSEMALTDPIRNSVLNQARGGLRKNAREGILLTGRQLSLLASRMRMQRVIRYKRADWGFFRQITGAQGEALDNVDLRLTR